MSHAHLVVDLVVLERLSTTRSTTMIQGGPGQACSERGGGED
jgi:hypothetical protein